MFCLFFLSISKAKWTLLEWQMAVFISFAFLRISIIKICSERVCVWVWSISIRFKAIICCVNQGCDCELKSSANCLMFFFQFFCMSKRLPASLNMKHWSILFESMLKTISLFQFGLLKQFRENHKWRIKVSVPFAHFDWNENTNFKPKSSEFACWEN